MPYSAAIAAANKADVQDAQDYFDTYGTLEGWVGQADPANNNFEKWGPIWKGMGYDPSDPAAIQNRLDASFAQQSLPPPKKKSNPLVKGLQGVVRVAKFLPGYGQAIGAIDDLAGGKLSGHAISKNPLINIGASIAGGALGAGLGMKGASSSVAKGAMSGARRGIQTQLGMKPDLRTGLGYLKAGGIPDAAGKVPDIAGAYGSTGTNMTGGAKEGVATGGLVEPDYGKPGQGLADAIGGAYASNPAMGGAFGGQAGYEGAGGTVMDAIKAGMGTTPGHGGTGAGTGVLAGLPGGQVPGGQQGGLLSNPLGMALITSLLGKIGEEKKIQTAPAPAPTPGQGGGGYGGGLPNYPSLLGMGTNAYAQDDQRRRLMAQKVGV